jgi:hypothetical protein
LIIEEKAKTPSLNTPYSQNTQTADDDTCTS